MGRRWKLVPLVVFGCAVLEFAVFVLAGRLVGFGWVVLSLVAASLAGLLLLRREGTRAWRGFRDAAQAGRPPADQVIDGLVGLGAGLLLTVPGLVSGVAGALLVVPPVRRRVRRGARVLAERRMSSVAAGDVFGPRRVRVYQGEPDVSGEDPVRPAEPGGRESRSAAIEGEIVP